MLTHSGLHKGAGDEGGSATDGGGGGVGGEGGGEQCAYSSPPPEVHLPEFGSGTQNLKDVGSSERVEMALAQLSVSPLK